MHTYLLDAKGAQPGPGDSPDVVHVAVTLLLPLGGVLLADELGVDSGRAAVERVGQRLRTLGEADLALHLVYDLGARTPVHERDKGQVRESLGVERVELLQAGCKLTA